MPAATPLDCWACARGTNEEKEEVSDPVESPVDRKITTGCAWETKDLEKAISEPDVVTVNK